MSRATPGFWARWSIGSAIVVALALSACGGGSDSTTTAPPGEPSAAQPSAEEEVEGAGREAEGSEAEAILSAKREYLTAVGNRDYGKACALLSGAAIKSLEASITHTRGKVGCAQILSKVLGVAAAQAARSQADGEVRRVRVLGDQALVIFRAPGARLWVLSLVKEDGGWRVATVVSSVLAPSASTLEGSG
jgi:hypothetical protein